MIKRLWKMLFNSNYIQIRLIILFLTEFKKVREWYKIEEYLYI